MERVSERMISRSISATEKSNANKELIDALGKWRDRDLSEEPIKAMFLDAVNFDVRITVALKKPGPGG